MTINLFSKGYGLILSFDVETLDDARRLAEVSVGLDGIVGYKIGFTLGLRYGLSEVTRVIKAVNPLPVIYDHQKAGSDIPAMGEPFARTCKDGGVDSVIFFPQAGPATLKAFVKAAFDYELLPIVGGAMTHEAYLSSEGGFICDSAVETIYKTALDCGVKDFVLPGTKPHIMERIAGGVLGGYSPLSIISPGFGTQGGIFLEAVQAVKGHRFYPIAGSAIYKAGDPKTAAGGMLRQLADAMGDAAGICR